MILEGKQSKVGGDNNVLKTLVLAPIGRDAQLITTALQKAKIDAVHCTNILSLCDILEHEGCGAITITTEALTSPLSERFLNLINSQEPWSDIPVILLNPNVQADTSMDTIPTLPNATVLERPIRLANLLSAIRTALRAREKQYLVRDLIAEAENARVAAERQQHRISELNERLRRAMTETHHRVKNNLQIIAALVDLQVLSKKKTVPIEEMNRLGMHVRGLAAIHDLLTRQAKLGSEAHFVTTSDIEENLLPLLRQTAKGFVIESTMDTVNLSARQATALTVVINELINNSYKHGKNAAAITLRKKDNCLYLIVKDDGKGFAKDFDPNVNSHTGLELVQQLCRWDLRGDIAFKNCPSGGAKVTITFPLAA